MLRTVFLLLTATIVSFSHGVIAAGTMNMTVTPNHTTFSAVGQEIEFTLTIENIDVRGPFFDGPKIDFWTIPEAFQSGTTPQFEDPDIPCTVPTDGNTGTCTYTYRVRQEDVFGANGRSKFRFSLIWLELSDVSSGVVPSVNWDQWMYKSTNTTGGTVTNTSGLPWSGSPSACQGMTGTDRGYTWIFKGYDTSNNVISLGSGVLNGEESNPYCGDTLCSQSLRMLCVNKRGAPMPGGWTSPSYWIGGDVAATQPVTGSDPALQDVTSANAYCASQFGTGWKMAEHHDSTRGWSIHALRQGNIPQGERYWTAIINQSRGNCWN